MLKKGKIHFFTGKGGVGKSTLSLAFAHELATQGLKTLWLEFAQTPTVKNLGPLEFEPREIAPHLSVSSWNGEDCLNEFVKHSVKLRIIYEAFYKSKAITALIKAAPALREIAFLGCLTSHLRDFEPSLKFDQIVVDAPSTGHFLACLKVPGALLDISRFGPMGSHCQGILDVLKDPEKTSIYSVFLAEPLVFLEYNDMAADLQSLGFQMRPWLNKSLNPKVIEDLEALMGATDVESKALASNAMVEKLIHQKAQEQQMIQKINSKILNITFEAQLAAIKEQVHRIVELRLQDQSL